MRQNKNVWITGIGGFLGSHLAEAMIDRGWSVAGNDIFICGSKDNVPKGVPCYDTDCRDFDSMKYLLELYKPNVLVHAAATAAEGFSVFSPAFITKNIYEASVATFSAAISAGVKHIVYMSSMARYGHGEPLGPPFKEDVHQTAPVDPYGIAKVAAEQTLKALCQEHKVEYTILVPHNIVGPRQEITPYRNVLSIFLNRLALDQPVYIYGDGEQKRSFSPVQDCISCLVQVVEEPGRGEIINIGPDGNEISINEILTICEEITDKKAKREYLAPRPITDDVKLAFCSSDKARARLGYKEKQTVRECLEGMWEDFVPKDFDYSFPVEIKSNRLPKTWKEQL